MASSELNQQFQIMDSTDATAREGDETDATAREGDETDATAKEGDETDATAKEGDETDATAREGDETDATAREGDETDATAKEGDETDATAKDQNALAKQNSTRAVPDSGIVLRDISIERSAPLAALPTDSDTAFSRWLAGSRVSPRP